MAMHSTEPQPETTFVRKPVTDSILYFTPSSLYRRFTRLYHARVDLQGEAPPGGDASRGAAGPETRIALAIVPPGNIVRDIRLWVAPQADMAGGGDMFPEALYLGFFGIQGDRAARARLLRAAAKGFAGAVRGVFAALPEHVSFDRLVRRGDRLYLAPGEGYCAETVRRAAGEAGIALGLSPSGAAFEAAEGILIPGGVSSTPETAFTMRRMVLALIRFRMGPDAGGNPSWLLWRRIAQAARPRA